MKTTTMMTLCVCGLMAAGTFAQTAKKAELSPEEKAARKAAVRAAMLKRTGGFVTQPNSAKGKVVLIDAQSLYNASNLTSVAALLGRETHFTTVAVKGSGDKVAELKAANGADVAVVAIQSATAPVLTVAPEEHWAAVNATKIADGLKSDAAKAKFAEARFRKELMRAFAFAAGGTDSQFPDNIMRIASLAEGDLFGEFIPGDTLNKASAHLKHLGLKPSVVATYRQACMQGWAPAPTNDIQKAIWDKAHEIPSKPIKIEFDPKRDAK